MARKRFSLPDPKAAVTDELLMQHIERGSRVIDLGCGDGRLLQRLRDEHGCSVQGVELDLDELLACVARGVPVLRADLDRRLDEIPDDAFDYAVLSQTLQQLRHPTKILTEVVRVAKRALVVVPNFGHWRVRHQVMWHGRAPVTSELPYEWYNTPNIHLCTISDFVDHCRKSDYRILNQQVLADQPVNRALMGLMPNLFAETAVYHLTKNGR